MEVPTNRTGIVIEIKYAEDGNLDAACEKALKQIEEKDYVAKIKAGWYEKILSNMELLVLRKYAKFVVNSKNLIC